MTSLSQIKQGLREEIAELLAASFLAFEWLEEGHGLPPYESQPDSAEDTQIAA